MKKIYTSILISCFAFSSFAQSITSVNPYTIPSTGSFTVTLVGHNTFFLSHPVSYVRFTQPNNSDGSTFTSTSETVIDDDSMTATFSVSNPAHGGFYDVTVVAIGITINTRTNGVYMTGTEPRRVTSITPDHGVANTVLTAQISGSQMHFMSSTGYPHVGSVVLTSEIDNSTLTGTNVNYIDTNNINVDFSIPAGATNGKYRLDIDLQLLNQTNRTYFFTVTGGIPRRIISVNPHQSVKGNNVQVIVEVAGRNMVTLPAYSATLASELSTYSFYISGGNIFTIDSNHVRLNFFVPFTAPAGDYTLTLNGNLAITKHYAFRIMPPNISGIIYNDLDNNGVQNGEPGLGGKKVLLLPDSIYALSDVNGYYFYYVDSGNYTLQYVPDSYILTSTPAVYNVAVNDSEQAGFNFGAYCPVCNEHEFYVWHHDLRCDYTGFSYWTLHNQTNGTQQGLLTLVHSSNLPVIHTDILPDSVHGDTLYWNYTLAPQQTITSYVNYQDPPAGSAVWYSYVDQFYTYQLTDYFSFVVSCSCDPNDKSVQPEEDSLHPTTLNTEELTYNINFQNTGTDTAFLVTIADTLDPLLDLATFELVGYSHPMVTNIDYVSRVVTFTFQNILLPDSNVDEPGSHGFARYKIKALAGIPDSMTVSNTAYIYFDFNPAVVTNTATSHLVYYLMPVTSFTTASQAICQLQCINFNSTSSNATTWQWSFPGGLPSSSTDENPQGICFLTQGSYDVTLITSNGFGADTLTIANYIVVNQLPPPPVIYESNDTLYCIPDPLYTAYQWYDTLGLIPGATNSYYVPTFSGLFGISVYNLEGCEAASTMPIILNESVMEVHDVELFPNPANDRLFISGYLLQDDVEIEITNVLGAKMPGVKTKMNDSQTIEIDLRNLSPGIYFVRFQNQNKTIQRRFIKN